jgi:ADP-heptose:LPS heptosyltransferase
MLRRNVLIFHAGALGDFIQTWPLGLALGRVFPQSRVIFVTHSAKGALAEKALRLESADIESGWHHLFGDVDRLPDACRKKLEGAHLIVNFIAKPRDAWTAAVAALSPRAQLITLQPGASVQLLESLGAFPAIQSAVGQILTSISQKGIGCFKPPETGAVAIHPGSGSPLKCWPVGSYLRLIDRLQADGVDCRIILGEVEIERWADTEIQRLRSAASAVQPATYSDLLDELLRCSAFVGNDSGPGQLAGIIAMPTVAIFGPTDPAVWKPLGPRVTAIRSQSLATLSPDDVYQALDRTLNLCSR